MLNKVKQTTGKLIILSIIFALLVSYWTSSTAFGVAIDPNMSANLVLSRELDRTKILLDDEFTINYKIEPQPLPASEITPPDKEIYLVMDTSGSMDFNLEGGTVNRWRREKKRIDISSEAANKFLDNLKGKSGVKVGLITYSDTGIVKQTLTSNLNSVKQKINRLNVVGGTNIGDGLRLGYYRLLDRSTDSSADKYLILLTDGEPTYHSVYRRYPYGFYKKDGNAPDFNGGGSKATPNDIIYCYEITEEFIKPSNIKSYMIAFSKGSNANVLNEVARKAGGIYKQALDSDALDKVYDDIYEQIIIDFSVENVKFEERFPEGLTVASVPDGFNINGQTVTGELGQINYTYNPDTNLYEADSVEFSITLKGSNAGNYLLNSSKLSYRDINKANKTKRFEDERVEVVALNVPITTNRSLSKDEMFIDEEFDVNYTIVPEDFDIDPELTPPNQLIVKNINFSEEFPKGFTVVSAGGMNISGRNVNGVFGDIVYTFDAVTNKYKADPINFTVTLTGDEGNYTLGAGNSSKIEYYDLDKENKEKSFEELYPRIVRFGMPALEIIDVNRRGEKVDIKLRVSLPARTGKGTLFAPQININDDGEKEITKVESIEYAIGEFDIDGRDVIYTQDFSYTGLSIYETHRVWLRAVSDFDENTYNDTEIITIFNAIDIN